MIRLVCLPLLLAAAPAFAQLPTDLDKPETRAEVEAKALAFHAQLDADHDGFVTMDEITAWAAAHAGANGTAAVPPAVQKNFTEGDTDKDGRLSAAEAKAAADRRFDAADTDHDGVLSPAERKAAMAKLLQALRTLRSGYP